MLTIVLGAPGSGKTSVAGGLRAVLVGHAVLDWDDFMPAVGALTGRDVRTSPELWEPYRDLVRALVVSLADIPTVLLCVCTPDELEGFPDARWLLLDCEDDERRVRLASRPVAEINAAVADAADYRRLGLRAVDSSRRGVESVVAELATLIDSR